MTCKRCGCALVSKGRGDRPHGVKRHQGRGLCYTCHRKSRDDDTLLDYEIACRPSADTLAEAEFMLSSGESFTEVARRLYPHSRRPTEALDRAIYRARAYARKAAA